MKTTERKDVYGIINDAMLAKLQQGIMPWKQSWNSFGPARNYVSQKPYRGINAMLLNHTSSEYPLFLTFSQVKDLGGTIKKGSKGNLVVFWKKLYYGRNGKIDPRNLSVNKPEDVTTIPLLRYYYVFNIDCVEGIDFKLPVKNLSLNPLENCEQLITAMPNAPTIEYGGDEPHYDWMRDKIQIPFLSNFTSEEEYYSTIFHELAHSTAHVSRLNRTIKSRPGSKDYAFEELIAETASCLLCNSAGIADKIIDNSASYIQGWLKTLSNILADDERFLVKAFAQAQRAADFILNLHDDEQDEAKSDLQLEPKGA